MSTGVTSMVHCVRRRRPQALSVVFNAATGNVTLGGAGAGNTFTGTRSDFFEAIANNNTSWLEVVVRSNDFNNGQTIVPGGGVGVSVRGGSGGNKQIHW